MRNWRRGAGCVRTQEDLRQRVEAAVAAIDKLQAAIIPNVLEQLVTVPHFAMAMSGNNHVESYKKIARYLRSSDPVHKAERARSTKSLSYVAKFVREAASRAGSVVPEAAADAAKEKRVKVGFSFFREHASGKMIQGVIDGLDKERFEVVVFCLTENNGRAPAPPHTGPVADRIRKRADHYVELDRHRGLAHARATIESYRLDVLVYAEIGMDPMNFLLAFARLARVQVATLGHYLASTTGIDTLDYYVSYKPFETADAQTRYSEQLVTFSDTSPYFEPAVPEGIGTRGDVLQRLQLANVTAGSTTIFVCLQTLGKVAPAFDAVVAGILRRVPGGVVLFKGFRQDTIGSQFMQRLRRSVPDVAGRVHVLGSVLPPRDWHGLLRHADVILDSHPFGGYTTTLEAFASGTTPVVTLPHDSMAGRCTKGFYDVMGIDDAVARDPADFVRISTRLAHDAAFSAGLRRQIRSARGLLWQRRGAVEEWQRFLEQAAAGQRVDSLHQHSPRWARVRAKPKPRAKPPAKPRAA